MNVVIRCRTCKAEFVLKPREAGYRAWENGEVIQKAMPYLTADERELLISGICGTCFDTMFAEEEG